MASSAAASSRSGRSPGIVRASRVLPGSGRADEQQGMATGQRDLEGPSRLCLAADLVEVDRRLAAIRCGRDLRWRRGREDRPFAGGSRSQQGQVGPRQGGRRPSPGPDDRSASAASASVATGTISSPGASAASSCPSAGTRTRRTPRPASAMHIGSRPGTRRISPPRPTSPMRPARPRPIRSCSDPTRIPSAMARSSEAPALRRSAGREVHRDPPGRMVVAGVAERAPDTLPSLGQRRIRQPHDREAGQPGRDIDLDADDPSGDAVKGCGDEGCEHAGDGSDRHSPAAYRALTGRSRRDRRSRRVADRRFALPASGDGRPSGPLSGRGGRQPAPSPCPPPWRTRARTAPGPSRACRS